MLDISDLANTLGLSKSQVRRRLTALDGLIDNHIKRGRNQKLLVNSSGLELLKQLEAHRKEGLTTKDAVKEIKTELGKTDGDNHHQASEEKRLLKKQITQLQSEVEYLRNQLDRKDQQIHHLLPGSTDSKGILRRIWTRVW